jgi:8-oxo-dGTP pyrophosphatase MutT (NUDIX family)
MKSRVEAGFKKPGGVAVIIASMDFKKILVGRQRGGSNKDEYAPVLGKLDPGETCYETAALRELSEEFKIQKRPGEFMNQFMMNGTIVFIGVFDADITAINQTISTCIKDINKHTWHLREVDDVQWININPGTVSCELPLSRYAKSVISQYTKRSFYITPPPSIHLVTQTPPVKTKKQENKQVNKQVDKHARKQMKKELRKQLRSKSWDGWCAARRLTLSITV